MPAATAAAEPPLEPPALCPSFQGLCVGPLATGSVEPLEPPSGVLVLAMMTKPASFQRLTISVSCLRVQPEKKRLPQFVGTPPSDCVRSLSRKGTPLKGPRGSLPLAAARA